MANAPDDDDARRELAGQLQKVLARNAELAAEVEQLLKQTPTARGGVSVHVEKGTGVGVNEGELNITQTFN